jgi:type VI secretion system protein ImpF
LARGAPNQVLRPSLLDRLAGNVPSGVPGAQLEQSRRDLVQSVRRDLEWLLNTTAWLPWDLEDNDELRESPLAFGLPDLSLYSWTSEEDGRSISALLERTIRTHEPRLVPRTVKVSLHERREVADFRIRFTIHAVLHVEPVTEQVAYDSHFDLSSGEVKVERVA